MHLQLTLWKTAFARAHCRLFNMKIVACLQVIFLLTNRAIFANDLSLNSQFKIPGRSISVEVRARVIGMLDNEAMANQVAMRAGVCELQCSGLNRSFFKQTPWKKNPKNKKQKQKKQQQKKKKKKKKNRPKPGRPKSVRQSKTGSRDSLP